MEIVQRANMEKLRADFPILQQKVNGKSLVYFDNAATSQKPREMLESMENYYKTLNANVHRGLHTLSAQATERYENARKTIARFMNASPKEVIFTRGATEAINIIAQSFGRQQLAKGDVIVLTEMEHHSNLVPWQLLAQERKLRLEFVPVTKDGKLDVEKAREMLMRGPKIFSLTHVSNVMGTINPVKELTEIAHRYGVTVVVDAAQSVPHMPVDVKDLECDFLVFSAHKMCGPTGVGVLYGKKELLEALEPVFGGGDMIKEVYFDHAVWNDLPWKFEPGTPAIAEVIGFGEAVRYLSKIGMEQIQEYEQELVAYALEKMGEVKDLVVYGPQKAEHRCGIISFNLGDVHAHDVASVLDEDGIAIRSGHLCAMPLIEKLGVAAVVRASFYFYNTKEEVDALVAALESARKVFRL